MENHSVLPSAGPSLGYVPEDSRGIDHISDSEPPGLQGWRSRSRHAKPASEIQRLDVSPPCIEVIDHQLHHEVLGPLLLEEPLQDETAGASIKDGDLPVENLLESQRLVKALRVFEVLCGEERADQLSPRRNAGHFLSS